MDDLRAELKGLRERPYSLDFGLESGFAAEGIEDEICDLEDWTRGSVVPTQVFGYSFLHMAFAPVLFISLAHP